MSTLPQTKGIKHFVLISSLLVNGQAMGQSDNFNFRVLNTFGVVLGLVLVLVP